MEFCHLVGGYGRDPIDQDILSEESRKAYLRDGTALTIAEVPSLDESGYVDRKIVKIFSPPVKHEREKTSVPKGSDMYPSSHVISKSRV